ncbi:adenosine deaminase 2 [Drosophila eugracilis]|uniref:adenosine deaminase 2 n=1 Tax=Drosophila eugracilis TaxID=29029 RepID=UPI001BD9AC60|nr:adenosine deaminase 2 [Drosophila eugracilis]XP_041674102.1 adenosine deaminase 2 [Drosophila eugracilis]
MENVQSQDVQTIRPLSPPAMRVIRLDLNEEESRREIAESKYGGICFHVGIAAMLCFMVLVLICSVPLGEIQSNRTAEEEHAHQRQIYVDMERRKRLGSGIILNPLEEEANDRLMAVKQVDEEVHNLWRNYHSQPPPFLRHLNITDTDLYAALKSMPKGGLLHVHDSGMLKMEILIELTYRENLWVCVNIDQGFEDFRFSKFFPLIPPAEDYQCNWMLMSNFFEFESRTGFENRLRESLSVRPEGYETSSKLARHLRRHQRLIHGLITFRPIWRDFIYSMLNDFYTDGVQYVELRSSLPIMYDLEGENFTIFETADAIVSVSNIFKSTFKDFIGIKLIYSPSRDVNDSRMDEYLINARLLKLRFPDFFAGFDLNTFADECNLPLLGHSTQLLKIGKDIDFYFHAGESRCPDSSRPDMNLIDALLMGSKRVGNSVNLPFHPEIMKAMKKLKIAVEICPLSNHHLQYFNDFRQHPAAYLIAAGFPIVIGSDYPCFWNASPLTDDFYVAFVGVVSGSGNLRLLKQFALNSFLYSSLSEVERNVAVSKWRCNWNRWVTNFVNSSGYQ